MTEKTPELPSLAEAEERLAAFLVATTPAARNAALAALRTCDLFLTSPEHGASLLRDRVADRRGVTYPQAFWAFVADVYLHAGALEACRFALDRALSDASDREPGAESRAYYTLGWLDAGEGEWWRAALAWERSLALQPTGLRHELETRRALGEAWEACGQVAWASQHLGEALKIAAQMEAASEEVEILCALGKQSLDQEQPGPATRYYLEALERARDECLKSGEAHAEIGYGLVCASLGELSDAEAHLGVGLDLARGLEDSLLQLTALGQLADVRLRAGRSDEARAALEEAVFVANATGSPPALAGVYHMLALVHEATGKETLALGSYERALAERRRASDWAGMGATLNNIGALHHRSGNQDLARRAYQEALLALAECGIERDEREVVLENLRKLEGGCAKPRSTQEDHALPRLR